jgi:hypothetical protein
MLAGLAAGCVGAKEERARTGAVVELADSAGVEVAMVMELPALDDPAFEWRHTVAGMVPGSAEDPADEPPFYNPGAYTRLDDGTLVVTDRGEYRLVVIGADGSVLRRFGRRGRGPGEISGSSPAVWLGPDGAIMVADLANRRISSFTLDGELTRMVSMRVPPGRYVFESTVRPGAPELYVTLRSGRVPRPGEPATSGDSVARVDATSGEITALVPLPETPPLPPGGRPGTVMFQPRAVWTVLGSGLIVTGRTDRGTFRVYGQDGVLLREIRLPLVARPVRDADRAEIAALWQGATGSSRFAVPDPVISRPRRSAAAHAIPIPSGTIDVLRSSLAASRLSLPGAAVCCACLAATLLAICVRACRRSAEWTLPAAGKRAGEGHRDVVESPSACRSRSRARKSRTARA